MASTSSCKRSIVSCAKCRKQKKKCDRKFPSCSQCIAAGAICTGTSATSAASVPRSIVRYLESEIAIAEKQSPRCGCSQFEEAVGSTGSASLNANIGVAVEKAGRQSAEFPQEDNSTRQQILASDNMKMFALATVPTTPNTGLISRVRIGLTPSSACVGGRVSSTTSRPSLANKDGDVLNARLLQSMPLATARKLWADYMDRIQPESPFLDIDQANQHFQAVYAAVWRHDPAATPGQQSTVVRPSFDFIVVYFILAIATTLGPSRKANESSYMTLSMYLFEEGLRHFHRLQTFRSTMAWLQTLLLLLVYATVSPHSGNVWILSGAVMRTCIELGLHRDITIGEGVDALDFRRRVFWAAYCMDRSICSALQAPLSIPDMAINAELPALDENAPFLNSVVYYRLLSEIMHQNHQQDNTSSLLHDSEDWHMWLTSMEHKLRSWHQACRNQWAKHETLDFALSRGMMLLHRPSPRVPQPQPHSLVIAFESATTAASYYRNIINNGFFRQPWLSAYQMFEAAVVVLFCLRNGTDAIIQHCGARRIADMAKVLTENLQAISAQGWPEASAYAAVYERLLGALLQGISGPDNTAAFGPAQDAELMQLLNPASQPIMGKPEDPVESNMALPLDANALDFSLFNPDYASIWTGAVDDAELQLDFWLS